MNINSIEDSESSMDDKRLEKCGEFDAAFPMTTGYCQLLTESQYETQATTETEKALKELMEHLDKNPEVVKELMKKRKRDDEENSGFMSYMKLKMLSMLGQDVDSRFPVTEMECADKISELKEGMTKAFEYSLGRRCSKRLAEKRQRNAFGDENVTAIPAAPPLPPTIKIKKGKITPTRCTQETITKSKSFKQEIMSPSRTPLKDRNIQMQTPQSQRLRIKKDEDRRGSASSMGTWKSIGSLSSLHQELLSINPNKLLRSSLQPRSPGGTPKKQPRSRGSPSSLCNSYSTATPLYKALINGMHHKFRNIRSPSPVIQDSDMSEGFTP